MNNIVTTGDRGQEAVALSAIDRDLMLPEADVSGEFEPGLLEPEPYGPTPSTSGWRSTLAKLALTFVMGSGTMGAALPSMTANNGNGGTSPTSGGPCKTTGAPVCCCAKPEAPRKPVREAPPSTPQRDNNGGTNGPIAPDLISGRREDSPMVEGEGNA
jgi:hypothetical protein